MQPQLLTVIKEEVLKTWTSDEWAKWWIEPKYDGARLIYHKGQFLSRTGKPLHNLDHIAAELKYLNGWTLDGEVYGANWAETMSAARSSKTVKADNGLKFAVFDCMPDLLWETQDNPFTLVRRRNKVWELVCGMKNVHPVMHTSGWLPHCTFDYDDFATIHRSNLANGCDGTVLKLADSLYEFKRTKTWLKVKPVETFDCLVVGVKEGTGKYKGMLGALEILPEGQGKAEITTWCSGMDDVQRRAWWVKGHINDIIGKTIEVAARGVHKSGKLIEPRFIRIREDK